MNIRQIKAKDIEAVSASCLASFSKAVAKSLSEEGISTFSKIAASDAFRDRIKEDNLILVAESHGEIAGVIELKAGRHVAMFFVHPEQQMKGIGKKLLLSALSFARVSTVSVSASLSSVPAYEKYGFSLDGDVAESAGLIYQPMVIELNRTPLSGQ